MVLSPASTLHHEATTLLAEDPTTSGKGALLYHSVLGAIANGSVTAGAIAGQLGHKSQHQPGLVPSHRGRVCRPTQRPDSESTPPLCPRLPLLQFHFAVLEPHGALLRARNPAQVWSQRLEDVFGSQVRGPVFEQQARTWMRRFASDETLAVRDYVGPSSVSVDGKRRQLDVVVAGPVIRPNGRLRRSVRLRRENHFPVPISAISNGFALSLERGRLMRNCSSSARASTKSLLEEASTRNDVEIIGADRLYRGS